MASVAAALAVLGRAVMVGNTRELGDVVFVTPVVVVVVRESLLRQAQGGPRSLGPWSLQQHTVPQSLRQHVMLGTCQSKLHWANSCALVLEPKWLRMHLHIHIHIILSAPQYESMFPHKCAFHTICLTLHVNRRTLPEWTDTGVGTKLGG